MPRELSARRKKKKQREELQLGELLRTPKPQTTSLLCVLIFFLLFFSSPARWTLSVDYPTCVTFLFHLPFLQICAAEAEKGNLRDLLDFYTCGGCVQSHLQLYLKSNRTTTKRENMKNSVLGFSRKQLTAGSAFKRLAPRK